MNNEVALDNFVFCSGFFIIGQFVGVLLPPFLPVVKPKVASAPVNTLATKVISELPDFYTIGISM